MSALPPPIPTKKSSEGGRWSDRKHVKLAQKHLRPAKELATPPPQQRKNELKKKDTELQARRKALSRRADEFISGLTSKAIISAVDSPRQQQPTSINYGENMALESRLRDFNIHTWTSGMVPSIER